MTDLGAPAPVEPRWLWQTVAVVASGASLTAEDAQALVGRARIIAVNDSWRLVPQADVLYAADLAWWQRHDGVPDFAGERWTQDKGATLMAWNAQAARFEAQPDRGQAHAIRELAARHRIRVVRSERAPGISFDPGLVHQGWPSGFSGFQAINLAALFGASRIVLIGFDCQPGPAGTHWFGEHPAPLNQGAHYAKWIEALDHAAPQLERAGIEVINCSRATAIACFQRADVREVFDALALEQVASSATAAG